MHDKRGPESNRVVSPCCMVGVVHYILCAVSLLILLHWILLFNPPNNPLMQTVLLSLIPQMSEGTCLGLHSDLSGE